MELKLTPSARHGRSQGPLLLVVMDGVGCGAGDQWDAVARARTPTLSWLRHNAHWRSLRAHGHATGMPSEEDMGNSEVGHNALGAGQIVDQGAKLVGRAIRDGSLFASEVWHGILKPCLEGRILHLIGLLSDGNVHSHEDHLHAMLRDASRSGVRKGRVHVLLDGRDVPGTSALVYLERLERLLSELNAQPDRDYRIASGGGRMVTTMDRYEADWHIVERGWNAHVHGIARAFASASDAVTAFRLAEPGILDQFLPPFVVSDERGPVGRIQDGDSVVLFNFRGDRAIELSRAFEEGDTFRYFDRGRRPQALFAGMTLYDGDLSIPRRYLVLPPVIEGTLSECLARTGVRQLAVSETQKFGHVTYFWNGNRSGMFDPDLETYIEIESDRVPFEQRPWMKAAEVSDLALEALAGRLKGGAYDFCRLNFPNGDMVGHTGQFDATVIAVETVDLCLARLVHGVQQARGTLVVVADHGNAEEMVFRDTAGRPLLEENGQPKIRTSHSLNPVPFMVYRPDGPEVTLTQALPDAGLANVAATLTELLGYEPPSHFLPSLLAP